MVAAPARRRSGRRRAAALAALLLTACGSVTTKDAGKGFVMMSEREEFGMGDQFADAFARGRIKGMPRPEFIEVPDAYLQALGRELAESSQRPNVPYRFEAINDNTINAFAVPGHIYVYRGVIELCETESEFAVVVGHEIGHVVARHSAKQMSKAWMLSHGTEFVLAALGADQLAAELSSLALFGALMKFGRDDERQADLLGVEECLTDGIDPRGAITLFHKFEKALKERPNLIESFTNNHPWSAERAQNIEDYLKTHSVPAGARTDRSAFQAWRAKVLATPKPPDRK